MKFHNATPAPRGRPRMRGAAVSIATAALTVLATPASAYDVSAEAKLHDANHHQVGKVRLTQQGRDNVTVHVSVRNLEPGFHGFHVHAIGSCTAVDRTMPFTSAGGHFNPGATAHGEHAGDFPVLLVQSDGTADMEFDTDRFTLEALFDGDGSAIIIHAAEDNYANIPLRYVIVDEAGRVVSKGPDTATLATGDSGLRVACGVLERIVKRDKERGRDKER